MDPLRRSPRAARCPSAPTTASGCAAASRRRRGRTPPRSCSSTASTASPASGASSRSDLRRAGFATLAYASRRAGETDQAVLARDLTGAVRALGALPEVDPGRIALAGSSVGGSAVAFALGTRPGLPVRGGVAFSAVTVARSEPFRPHDLLLISDQREAQTARELRAAAGGRGITLFTVEASAHGSALLDDPTARARAIAWLQRLARGEP